MEPQQAYVKKRKDWYVVKQASIKSVFGSSPERTEFTETTHKTPENLVNHLYSLPEGSGITLDLETRGSLDEKSKERLDELDPSILN